VAGFTLVELLFVVGLGTVLATAAVAQVTAGLARSQARLAARYLAAEMAAVRMRAVGSAASVALRFGTAATGYDIAQYQDGNRNGVRTREMVDGTDRLVRAPERLSDRFPGVSIALVAEAGVGGDPVKFGASRILTFTPGGTASPGSVYVRGRDGSQYVVRVTGATARTRVERLTGTAAWGMP